MDLLIIDHKPEEIIMTIKIFKNIISGVRRLLKVMVLVENSKIAETIILKVIFNINISVTGTQGFIKVTSNLTEITDQMISKVIKLNHTINKKEIIKIIQLVISLTCINQNKLLKIKRFSIVLKVIILGPIVLDQLTAHLGSEHVL